MKSWTEARNNKYMKYHSTLTHQLSFWNMSRRVDCHAGKWFIHGPKTPQGESVAKPETPLLIILSIACKCSPWQHVQSVIRKARYLEFVVFCIPNKLVIEICRFMTWPDLSFSWLCNENTYCTKPTSQLNQGLWWSWMHIYVSDNTISARNWKLFSVCFAQNSGPIIHVSLRVPRLALHVL